MNLKTFITTVVTFLSAQMSAQNTWTGSTDNDWHKACNWSANAIPTVTDDVVIPTAGTYPVVSGNAHCRTFLQRL